MAHRTPLDIDFSLFELLKSELGETLPIAHCTKATLVYLSHALEDLVLKNKMPALFFTGFQESSHWREETQRYQELVEIAHQVCIFAGKPLPLETEAHEVHVELADDDPLRQEWFLAILTSRFAVVLCGQDNLKPNVSEPERDFDTLWTFEPRVINQVLDLLEGVVSRYRPEKLAQLKEARTLYPPSQPDAEIVTHFTLELVNYQENLHLKLLRAEREQRAINHALAESEERFRDVLDSVIHHIFAKAIWDDGTQVTLYISPNIEQYLGYPAQFFQDDPYFWASLVHPDDLPIRNAHVAEILAGESSNAEYRMRHKNGHDIRIRIHARLKRNPGADYMTMYAVVEDITKEYDATQALAASEQRFRDVLNSVVHHIYAKAIWPDGSQKTLYVSPNIMQYLGYPAGLFEDDPLFWISLIHPDDLPSREVHLNKLLAGEPYTIEYRIRHADGHYVWMRNHTNPKLIPDTDFITVYGVVEDITKEYEAAQALELMNDRFRLVIDSINQSFYISHIDENGIFSNVYIAPTLEQLTGYPVHYFEKDWNFWLSLIHPDDLQATMEQEARLRRGEDSLVEYRMQRIDGEWIWTRDSAKVLFDPTTGGKIVYGIHTNITEERETEQALAFSKERFDQVVASISHTIYVTQITPGGIFKNLYLSPNVEKMTGYPSREFEQDSGLWSTLIHPEDRPRDYELETKVLQGNNHDIEYRVHSVNDQWLWVRNSARLRSDPVTGNLLVYGVLEDVTERHEIEKALLKAEKMRVALKQAEELNAIRSQFMTTVSH
ncbi:MAG: PAS domain-containing protein, partial [Chitinophagaceae bacterium]|nr:PAS domain-containing protein [Anaerolineae bacterium]